MSTGFYPMAPGITVGRSTASRVVFRQRSELFLAQGAWIDGTKARDPGNTPDVGVLRPGTLMGQLTSGGKYANSVIGSLAADAAAAATSITISAAEATELVRRVGATGTIRLVGPPTAGGVVATFTETFSAVNLSTGVVTVSGLDAALEAGSFVCADDGTYLPKSFIPDWNSYGHQVVDQDGVSVAAVDYPKMPVWGIVDSSQLLPWPADTSLRQWIVDQLNAVGQYVFDHKY